MIIIFISSHPFICFF